MGDFYRRRGKRAIDATAAAAAIVVLSPLMAGTALAVRWRLGAPVTYSHKRGGLNGTTFNVVKFRTMTNERDADGNLLPDAARMTPLGQRIRELSLDELPELFSIVRGQMSLVGPRPLDARYLSRFDERQARRHEVRPGLTGWAQVNGRNGLDWTSRFELDLWYVDHVSLRVDARIIARTLATVIRREGIAAGDHATMPEFMGGSQP